MDHNKNQPLIFWLFTKYNIQYQSKKMFKLKYSVQVTITITLIITKRNKEKKEQTANPQPPSEMKMKSSSSAHSKLLSSFYCCFFFILVLANVTTATDHIVGANKGWNPGFNYTLWANNQTFYVGDLISFRYQKTQYNVFEVNQTGYDNCTTEGALGNWSSGKDFIPLDKAKRYYFICGNGQCYNGMKVSVLVHPLPPPPSSSVVGNQTSDSAPGMICFGGLAGFRTLVLAFASTGFGIGWMYYY